MDEITTPAHRTAYVVGPFLSPFSSPGEHGCYDFGFYYVLKYNNETFAVVFNADQINFLDFEIPDGIWDVLTDKNTAGAKPLYEVNKKVNLEPVTGMVLKLK